MVENRNSFSSDHVSIDDLCDVIGGNYRGHRGFVKRSTAEKVVIQLESRKKEIMILHSSIAAINTDVDIEDESVNEDDRIQFFEGRYRGEGYVIKRHR
jgi:transcription elongation factor